MPQNERDERVVCWPLLDLPASGRKSPSASILRCGAGDTAEAAEWVASILGPDDPRLAQLLQIINELAEDTAGP